MTPIFSVVVPIYGVEKFLRKCVDSILCQTFRNFEVILVDDGSRDKCPAICDEYERIDARIHVIHKKNGGLVSARQVGVEQAKGDYVVCVDGDDWLERSYLEAFARIIEAHHPDVIVCGYRHVGKDGVNENKTGWKEGYYDRKSMEREIFPSLIQAENATYFPKTLWSKAFKRVIYQQQQIINTIVNMGEDSACTIPTIYHSQSLYISNACGYNYRINLNSMCNNKKPLLVDGPRLIHEHICRQVDISKFDFAEQLYRKTTHELFSVIVSLFYKKQGFWKTRKEICTLLRDDIYAQSVHNCHFSGSIAAKMMELSLKYKLIFPIYLYSKLR